jgi:hypothetical protein
MGCYGLDLSGSQCGQIESSYEHGNKISGSIKFLGNSSVTELLAASQGLSPIAV